MRAGIAEFIDAAARLPFAVSHVCHCAFVIFIMQCNVCRILHSAILLPNGALYDQISHPCKLRHRTLISAPIDMQPPAADQSAAQLSRVIVGRIVGQTVSSGAASSGHSTLVQTCKRYSRERALSGPIFVSNSQTVQLK